MRKTAANRFAQVPFQLLQFKGESDDIDAQLLERLNESPILVDNKALTLIHVWYIFKDRVLRICVLPLPTKTTEVDLLNNVVRKCSSHSVLTYIYINMAMTEWLFGFTEQIKAVGPKSQSTQYVIHREMSDLHSLLIVFAAVINLVKNHALNSCLCDADHKGLKSDDCQREETWPGLLCKEIRYIYIFQKKVTTGSILQ